uniref:Uncharacterized protein n=1 Tax=Lactuca sativa TaxID=4236 RepID=A0A9R1XSI6_LACSA|nr:hypothetical protein LSAT_V11C300153870 [Lactuca sativa]
MIYMLLEDTVETVGVNLQDSRIRSLELVSHLTNFLITCINVAKPKRSFGRNLNLYEWFRLNKKKPFPLEFDITGRLYTVVGDNYQNYFDIDSFRDTPHWNNIVQGIDANLKASYRCRKSKYRGKHVYGSSHGAESYAQKQHKEKKETGRANHIDGWKKSHFKEGKGWCHPQAQHDWVTVMLPNFRKKKLINIYCRVDGDDSLVNQTECLKRSLGERSSHTRGVGRKMKNIALYYVPSTSTNAQNFNPFAQELTQ